MNTNQDTTLTNQDEMIDIKPLKQADIVQIIRTAESLDDAVNKMNGLAANGWLTLWDNATHPDGTSYRDLPAWKEATKASVELVDELKAATKASEKRIQELEADLELLKPHPKCDMGCMLVCNMEGNAITELQADNLRLRDALEESKNVLEIAMTDRDGNKFVYLNTRSGSMLSALDTLDKCNKALSSTPAQSLAEHNNELIERCAKEIDKMVNVYTKNCDKYKIIGSELDVERNVNKARAAMSCAEVIRSLKVTI